RACCATLRWCRESAWELALSGPRAGFHFTRRRPPAKLAHEPGLLERHAFDCRASGGERLVERGGVEGLRPPVLRGRELPERAIERFEERRSLFRAEAPRGFGRERPRRGGARHDNLLAAEPSRADGQRARAVGDDRSGRRRNLRGGDSSSEWAGRGHAQRA